MAKTRNKWAEEKAFVEAERRRLARWEKQKRMPKIPPGEMARLAEIRGEEFPFGAPLKEPTEPMVQPVPRREGGGWKRRGIDGTVVATRKIRLIHPKTRKVLSEKPETKYFFAPTTYRCYKGLEPKTETKREKIEAIFACADEQAGMLTPSVAGILTGTDPEGCLPKQPCIARSRIFNLVKQGILRDVGARTRGWAGEPHYAMTREMREKIRKKYETR